MYQFIFINRYNLVIILIYFYLIFLYYFVILFYYPTKQATLTFRPEITFL